MKKKIIIVLMGLAVLTGCSSKKNNVTITELNNVNNQIIEYFKSELHDYDNMSFNYVDETNMVVVVGLYNNSKNEQKEFQKKVIKSDNIMFVKSDGLINVIKK